MASGTRFGVEVVQRNVGGQFERPRGASQYCSGAAGAKIPAWGGAQRRAAARPNKCLEFSRRQTNKLVAARPLTRLEFCYVIKLVFKLSQGGTS